MLVILDMGILAVPISFIWVGWLGGIVLSIICCFLTWYCAYLLMAVSDKLGINAKNYPEFVLLLYGKFAAGITHFLLII
jgi:amino acid permease